jgi:hypothetical protein
LEDHLRSLNFLPSMALNFIVLTPTSSEGSTAHDMKELRPHGIAKHFRVLFVSIRAVRRFF